MNRSTSVDNLASLETDAETSHDSSKELNVITVNNHQLDQCYDHLLEELNPFSDNSGSIISSSVKQIDFTNNINVDPEMIDTRLACSHHVENITWSNDGYNALSAIIKMLESSLVGKHYLKYCMKTFEYVYHISGRIHPWGWLVLGENNCRRVRNSRLCEKSISKIQKIALALDYMFTNYDIMAISMKDYMVKPEHICSIAGKIILLLIYGYFEQIHILSGEDNELMDYKLHEIVDIIHQHLGFPHEVIMKSIYITRDLANICISKRKMNISNHHKLYTRCLDVDISFLSTHDRRYLNEYFGRGKNIYIRFMMIMGLYLNKYYSTESVSYSFHIKLRNVSSPEELIKILNNSTLSYLILVILRRADNML